MKVLFSHDIFVSQPHGGASRLFVGLHHALRSRGVKSRVCAGLHINTYLRHEKDVTGFRVGDGGSRRVRGLLDLCDAQLERAVMTAWHPSVYHLTYFPRHPQRFRAPIVVTVLDMIHELYSEEFPEGDRTSDRKRHWSNAADHVFAISQRTKDDLMRLFSIPEEKVSVVYPGVAPLRPDPLFDTNSYGDYLLYVGERGIPYKNFDLFVAAMGQSALARDLHLVCFGGNAIPDREKSLLSKAGLLTRTHHVRGSDAQLAALYVGARALVYPSKYEGFGFPPLEAMSLGCPVTCSRGGSLPEVVGDAALLFDGDDVDDMASALDRVVGDDPLRRTLVAAGTSRVETFTWDRAGRDAVAGYLRV